MAIDRIIQSIRTNKQNHLVNFGLRSKTEEFTNALFHILFDAETSVRDNIEDLAEMFKEIYGRIETCEEQDYISIWKRFLIGLPDILKKLNQDAKCLFMHDPAANSVEEVILAYPGFFAIAVYRLSNEFQKYKMPLVPRMMSEYAHRLTGIDIHPGASIGSPFFIDHGTGVVIGESAVIRNHVKIYQGVTLGALQVSKDMKDTKRHPTVEDDVTIYAGSTILGGETVIGAHSTIGGNVWLTESVPPNSLVYQTSEVKLKSKISES
jgi:serine O-acetyltransferase